MKYYKITLDNVGGTVIYPKNYQSEVGDMATDHLYWSEGAQYYLLLCIPDKKSSGILRDNVQEITETEAIAISDAKERRTRIILDEGEFRRLELKVKLGEVLSQEELDCLDPKNPKSIFSSTTTLSDRIKEEQKI